MPTLDEEPTYRSARAGIKRESTSSRYARRGRTSRRSCGRRSRRKPGGGRAARRCGTYWPVGDAAGVLDFLSTTDVGRLVPAPVEEEGQREASEWERRQWREREEGRRQEAEELGAGGKGQPLFLPTPSFIMTSAEEE
jgi:hypothetical protein